MPKSSGTKRKANVLTQKRRLVIKTGNAKRQKTDTSMIRLHFGNKNDCVATPKDLYAAMNKRFKFKFDPCPINPKRDGLSIPWKKVNYVNPPYSNIKGWMKKAVEEMERGNKTVFLVTVRPNTNYWFNYVFPHASEIYFIRDKICFQGYDTPFPMPCCLIVFNPNKKPHNRKKRYEKIGQYNFYVAKM